MEFIMTRHGALGSLMIVAWFLTLGCSPHKLYVTYYSDPPGAALYEGERAFGYCPMTLEYTISGEDRKRGFTILRGTTVRWVSGAKANIEQLRADLKNGTSQQFTFIRPEGFDGLHIDASFALELERNNILQRQAEALDDQAFWQMYNSVMTQQQLSKPRSCSSYIVGNTVQTSCQ